MEKVYSGGWYHIMRLTHHWEPDGVGWRSSPLRRRQSLSSPGNNLAVLDKSILVEASALLPNPDHSGSPCSPCGHMKVSEASKLRIDFSN